MDQYRSRVTAEEEHLQDVKEIADAFGIEELSILVRNEISDFYILRDNKSLYYWYESDGSFYVYNNTAVLDDEEVIAMSWYKSPIGGYLDPVPIYRQRRAEAQ